jgi:hypothetical protein
MPTSARQLAILADNRGDVGIAPYEKPKLHCAISRKLESRAVKTKEEGE